MWLPLVCPTPGTWPTTQACALTGNQIGDPLVCRPVLNPLSYTSQGQAPLSGSCTFKIPSKLSPRRTEHTVPSLRKGQTLSCPLLALTCRSFHRPINALNTQLLHPRWTHVTRPRAAGNGLSLSPCYHGASPFQSSPWSTAQGSVRCNHQALRKPTSVLLLRLTGL